MTTATFHWAVKRMGPYIVSLRLSDRAVTGNLSPQALAIAVRGCPFLTNVDLSGATVRPPAIRDLIPIATNLRKISLGPYHGHLDPELTGLLGAATQLLDFGAKATEFQGKSLFQVTPALRTLRLCQCPSVLPAPLAAAFGRLSALAGLELSHCDGLTSEEPLHQLVANQALHNTLEDLKIIGISFDPVMLDPELEDIEVPEDLQAPYVELNIGPADAGTSLAEAFTRLHTLHLRFCGWVSNSLLIQIGEHLKELEQLDLSGCSNIRGQFALEELPTLPKLREIHLCNLHPSVGIQPLGSIRTLQEVQCRDSSGITDEDVCQVVRGCPALVRLNIEGCQGVTQQTVVGVTEIVRREGRSAVLSLWVGETGANRFARVRQSLLLRVFFDRAYQPILA
ncbi:SCF E3 ubiquitin ligase complex F-box protein grrA-like [Osmia bicornis bicornis]|uniref:SCF E3 ubiquitin ligase complex F-box protein grrA-like n=1 Tax=Osmia bicornis bicornis TaxID=1437191 RepID=UPI001EAF5908|nr:SCF E3 ubiquitin ligase complex F-box protein grrA-like [Osmia bicornis bicornis]